MIGNRMCAFALSTAFAIICSAPPAIAAQFDGNWSMLAVTTSGHCGKSRAAPMGPDGSVGLEAAGRGLVPGPLVSARAFGTPFAPNASTIASAAVVQQPINSGFRRRSGTIEKLNGIHRATEKRQVFGGNAIPRS